MLEKMGRVNLVYGIVLERPRELEEIDFVFGLVAIEVYTFESLFGVLPASEVEPDRLSGRGFNECERSLLLIEFLGHLNLQILVIELSGLRWRDVVFFIDRDRDDCVSVAP
jgi:hypothetical protein